VENSPESQDMHPSMSPPLDEGYPLTFSVDYPDRKLDRVSTGLRIFDLIPILILIGLLANASFGEYSPAAVGGGLVVLPLVLMLLFRKKYPRWWFDWNRELLRFTARIGVYASLMNDEYPSTDEQQTVHLDFDYPDARNDLHPALPLVKWLLAIPHYIVLFFLYIAAFFVVVFAWFAVLFTGRYPRGAFTFVEGVHRWTYRVQAYAFVLVTDKYPPFNLKP
jgi:hypothetical protein